MYNAVIPIGADRQNEMKFSVILMALSMMLVLFVAVVACIEPPPTRIPTNTPRPTPTPTKKIYPTAYIPPGWVAVRPAPERKPTRRVLTATPVYVRVTSTPSPRPTLRPIINEAPAPRPEHLVGAAMLDLHEELYGFWPNIEMVIDACRLHAAAGWPIDGPAWDVSIRPIVGELLHDKGTKHEIESRRFGWLMAHRLTVRERQEFCQEVTGG